MPLGVFGVKSGNPLGGEGGFCKSFSNFWPKISKGGDLAVIKKKLIFPVTSNVRTKKIPTFLRKLEFSFTPIEKRYRFSCFIPPPFYKKKTHRKLPKIWNYDPQ